MRIEFERSGGLAGMRLSLSIDTDTLPADEAEEIVELVEESNFFELPERIETPSGAADTFNYKITVESGDRSHTVVTSDMGAPPELVRLFGRLEREARGSRGE